MSDTNLTAQASASPPTTGADAADILSVRDLKVHFPVFKGVIVQKQVAKVHAVDGVSFNLRRGETLGLVGESGRLRYRFPAIRRAAGNLAD